MKRCIRYRALHFVFIFTIFSHGKSKGKSCSLIKIKIQTVNIIADIKSDSESDVKPLRVIFDIDYDRFFDNIALFLVQLIQK